MKIKTLELTGIALDYAVAMCDGITDEIEVNSHLDLVLSDEELFSPSTDWMQGGPIIERECINLTCCYDKTTWFADIDQPDTADMLQKGESLLIAAMRCYVASRLGETVEIPNELLK